jgi:hypothetical protein
MSLMQRHLTSMDTAMANVISQKMGKYANLEHMQLTDGMKAGLSRYGINELEWNTLRRGIEDWSQLPGMSPEMGDLKSMLTVSGVDAMPDEVFAKYAKDSGMWKGDTAPSSQVIERARSELTGKMGAMISDHADISSSTGGVSERAFMYGNHDQNSFSGLALRLLWQFKSAIVKNYDTVMRSYLSNPNKPKGDWTKIARHALLGAGLYGTGELAKQTLSGQTPENPLTPQFAATALINSGFGGLAGDVMIGEAIRSGLNGDPGQFLQAAAGPVVGAGADVASMTARVAGYLGDANKFPANQLGRFVTQHVPFQNLFYTKAAFNYYVTDSIREWLAPGYMKPMNKTMRDKGQEFFMFDPNQ